MAQIIRFFGTCCAFGCCLRLGCGRVKFVVRRRFVVGSGPFAWAGQRNLLSVSTAAQSMQAPLQAQLGRNTLPTVPCSVRMECTASRCIGVHRLQEGHILFRLGVFSCFGCFWLCLAVFGCFEVYFLESHRSVIFRIPFRPRSGRRAFATIFCDSGEKVAQLAGSFFSNPFFEIIRFFCC